MLRWERDHDLRRKSLVVHNLMSLVVHNLMSLVVHNLMSLVVHNLTRWERDHDLRRKFLKVNGRKVEKTWKKRVEEKSMKDELCRSK